MVAECLPGYDCIGQHRGAGDMTLPPSVRSSVYRQPHYEVDIILGNLRQRFRGFVGFEAQFLDDGQDIASLNYGCG